MGDGGVDIGLGRQPLFDKPRERIKPRKTLELLGVAEPRRIERSPEETQRFVVDRQRHRKRMSVLAAVRECEPRRIGESCRGTVNDLRHQRERLQRARPELFQE